MTTIKSAAWKLSNSLKRTQLQSIATSIGAPISGTKPDLLNSIHHVVEQSSTTLLQGELAKDRDVQTRYLRVLSIDMGIRNLAFAFLTCRMNSSKEKDSRKMFAKPELRQWRRIGLFDLGGSLEFAEKDMDADSTTSGITQKEPQLDTGSDAIITPDSLDESFEPPVLAKHAYAFAKYCAGLRPTHILIERQRFRSAGHTAVLEWSLRVGMVESMLHSTFHTFNEEGVLSNVSVEPILPMRVNKFWFVEQEELLANAYAEGALEKGGKKEAKLAKIAIVSEMLSKSSTREGSFSVHVDAKPTVDAFVSRSAPRSGMKKATSSLEKLDDVADSLLQGLAWLKWQENRGKLLTASSALDIDTDVSSFFKT